MTILKDYYTILGVRAAASAAEIKRSYRRLAMKYHPDKNAGDALANALFQDIAEAYKVLSNPESRRQYDYRSTGGSNRKAGSANIITEDSVLDEITVLRRMVASANALRVNEEALFFRISQILTPFKLQLLQVLPAGKKREATSGLIACCAPLSYLHSYRVGTQLLKIAADDKIAQTAIQQFLLQSLRSSRWNKYKVLLAVAMAVLLCLLIFLLK